MEKNLKVKYSTFQTEMTFNEWTQTYGVGSKYKEKEPELFQGNPKQKFKEPTFLDWLDGFIDGVIRSFNR